jgi:uncharacterized protein (TIGR00369 family)
MEPRNPDFRDFLAAGFAAAPFVHENGIRPIDCGAGWCESAVDIAPHHLQQNGFVHAGLIATLADHTAGAAAFTLAGADQTVLTAEFKVSLLRAAKGERLTCRAEVIKPGSQLSFVESTVEAHEGGRSAVVARASVTLAIVARR